MELKKARLIADGIVTRLRLWCERIEIAGSSRREKPEVGDIEICAIPKKIKCDFFGGLAYDPGFNKAVFRLGTPIKGMLGEDFKYAQLEINHLYGKINLDLFVLTPDNWGWLFAVRTGSADFSHNVLAKGWAKMGYHGIGGMLTKGGA